MTAKEQSHKERTLTKKDSQVVHFRMRGRMTGSQKGEQRQKKTRGGKIAASKQCRKGQEK